MISNSRWFDEEKTIILHEFAGRMVIAEALQAIHKSIETLESDHHNPKYFIFDMQKVIGVPHDILGNRPSYDELTEEGHITIVIGAHPLVKTCVNALKLMGFLAPIFFTYNLEEAEQLIKRHKQQDAQSAQVS